MLILYKNDRNVRFVLFTKTSNALVILKLITVLRFTMHTLSYLALTISGQVPEKAVRTLSHVRRTGSYLESLFEEYSVHIQFRNYCLSHALQEEHSLQTG